MDFDVTGKRIFVSGHSGLVGSSIVRKLETLSCEILTAAHADLDLRRQTDTEDWFKAHRPNAVIVAAAHVGGIDANKTYPAKFLYDNAAIAMNVIEAARSVQVKKLLYLSAACTYPRMAEQPIHEDALMTGTLEPTNEWYAIAKITGMKLCEAYNREYGCNFISAQPSSLYGPGDNFDPNEGHVVAGMITKFHQAKIDDAPCVGLWGTGTPIREFMYIDDGADALVHILGHYTDPQPINVGMGTGTTIKDLAETISDVVGYSGQLDWDTDRPDGMPKRMLDSGKLTALGWKPPTSLRDGLAKTYEWYVANVAN